MSYMSKEKAKTMKDKVLAMKHLIRTIALDKDKVKEHEEVADKEGYSKEYNEDHAKDHKKDIKGAQKVLKKYRKAVGSYNDSTVQKAINIREGR